jgi:hypothetical protein
VFLCVSVCERERKRKKGVGGGGEGGAHVRIACIQTGTHAYTYESTYKDPAQAKAPPLASQSTIKKSSLGLVFFCIVVCA